MLTINRVRSFKPRFVVEADAVQRGAWAKEKLSEPGLAAGLAQI